jgi:transposase
MIKNGVKLKVKRIYSEEFRKARVQEYESGELTISQISRLYNIGNSSIYKWVYKYSLYNSKGLKIVEMSESTTQKVKTLETTVAELERLLGKKQIQIDFLETTLEVIKEEHGIDFKKKSNTQPSQK